MLINLFEFNISNLSRQEDGLFNTIILKYIINLSLITCQN